MKLSHVIPLAALSSAFVLPDEQIFSGLARERCHDKPTWFGEAANFADRVASGVKSWGKDAKEVAHNAWETTSKSAAQAFDQAIEYGTSARDSIIDASHGVEAWIESESEDLFSEDEPHHGPPPHKRPPHHKPGRGRPHHPPPHHSKPNQSIYEIISESKYTTKLAKLISEYDDLVDALNSTKANFTLFAPIDAAFDKIPKGAPKPSKEQLKALLSYHVVPDFYPARRVLFSHTAPTLLKGEHLSSKPEPQRIVFKLGLRGLTVNFYSRVIGINFFATNGVIHGVSSLLLPPPNAITVINLLPTAFSTLELGLSKTGLLDTLNTTDHAGGTFFAPSNNAFSKLGPKINAFLFSRYGTKYLKALLEYHVVPDFTLYSDAYYKAETEDESIRKELPRGKFHVDLPTLLEDRSLSIDVVRVGGFTTILINGFSRIAVSDGIAEDGVIHVVSNVLIPPKKLGGDSTESDVDGAEMTVEELKSRLEPFVYKGDL